jgi:hypothetical protein
MRYTITDEMPPELHNLIGRKVTHAGIYTEAGIKGELGNIIVNKARAAAPKTVVDTRLEEGNEVAARSVL